MYLQVYLPLSLPHTFSHVPPNITATISITSSNTKRFISEPVPRSAGIVQCYILRVKKGVTSLYPQYLLHMKDFDDKFLLAAKKRGQNKTSNYLICMDPENLDRSGENYVGKLRSNFWGTEFVFCE